MRRIRASLALKALGLQLAGLLASAGVVGALRYYSIRAGLYREVETSVHSLSQVMEDLLAERPELWQPRALDALMDRFARQLPAVASVRIVDGAGNILADSHEFQGDPLGPPVLLPLLMRAGEQRVVVTTAHGRYLRLTRSLRGRYDPIRHSDITGALSLDVRLALTDAAVSRELVKEMALVLLLFVPIGALLYLRTQSGLVRPLEQLAAAGARFARGEVPPPLTFSGRDELAGVARTFNEMVEARTSALKDRERQLREAQAIAHIGSWEVDLKTNQMTWSEEAYRIWGVPLGTPVDYERFITAVHPEDRERVRRVTTAALGERRDIEFECRIARPDGQVNHMLSRNVLLGDPEGGPGRLAGTCLDITDRKRAEATMVQSEQYHRALIEQGLDLITLVDADAVITYASPSNERVLGYPPVELLGRRAFEFIHDDDLATVMRVFIEGTESPQTTPTLEFRFRHKNGSWRYLEASGRNLLNDPVIKAAVINARDVTARKAAEETQRTLVAELQASLAEVKVLRGILPICADCKRIHTTEDVWEPVESYVRAHTNAEFTHGLCPECARKTWGAASR
jgi:PAS domain S-box-containing protein